MKSIMLSIKPQWIEKIINKEKTIEIRKSKPSCELPCKVYIYCTKNNGKWIGQYPFYKLCDKKLNDLNGKVVGEFTLNKITKHEKNFIDFNDDICYNFKVVDVKNAGFDTDALLLVDFDAFVETYGNDKPLYAWHIDNLKIYDKPKELSEFSSFIPNNKCEKHENGFACDKCDAYDKEHDTCLALYYCHKPIKRPPQSYMFVEELEE